MRRSTANMMLLGCSAIWGTAFVAQSIAMHTLHPLWYSGLRCLIACVVIAPLAFGEWRLAGNPISRRGWWLIAAMCMDTFLSSTAQQIGMKTATVTNAGFLTGLYVLFTPIIGWLIYREQPRAIVWVGALVGLAGTYLLGGGLTGFSQGDGLIVISAVGWAIQIVLIGRAVKSTGRPYTVALVQTLFTGVVSSAIIAPFVPLTVEMMVATTWPLVYGGLISAGLAYSMQASAQRYTKSSDTAIILSAEAPFAALAGAVLLGERISAIGAVGCALIFSAILLVQLYPRGKGANA